MSGLKDRINKDLKAAMISRDSFLSDVLKGLKAAILNQEIAEGKREEGLDDHAIEFLLARESKKREEAAKLYEQGGNQMMADKERKEKEVISTFLPEQLTESEIEVLIDKVILDVGAAGPQDMGKVIGAVKAKTGTTADGALIAKIAKNKLQ